MQARIPGFLLHPGSPSFPCEGGRVRATSIPLRMSPLSSDGVGTTSSVPAPLLLENGGGRAFLKPPLPPLPTPISKDFRLYRIPIAGDCQERKSLLRTRGRLFAIGENRKPDKTRAAKRWRHFFVFVLPAVFLPVTLPPAARGAKGRPARSPGGRDNRRGHAGSCHCGRRPASPQRRPRRRDHG